MNSRYWGELQDAMLSALLTKFWEPLATRNGVKHACAAKHDGRCHVRQHTLSALGSPTEDDTHTHTMALTHSITLPLAVRHYTWLPAEAELPHLPAITSYCMG